MALQVCSLAVGTHDNSFQDRFSFRNGQYSNKNTRTVNRWNPAQIHKKKKPVRPSATHYTQEPFVLRPNQKKKKVRLDDGNEQLIWNAGHIWSSIHIAKWLGETNLKFHGTDTDRSWQQLVYTPQYRLVKTVHCSIHNIYGHFSEQNATPTQVERIPGRLWNSIQQSLVFIMAGCHVSKWQTGTARIALGTNIPSTHG